MSKRESYRIMGVDPGTNILGYGIIEINNNKVKLIDYGVINMQRQASAYKKLKTIYVKLQELIKVYHPTELAIEAPFFGKNVQSMLKLGRAQGVAIAAAITQDLEVTEYAPKKIKKSVTGKGGASKEQVAAMIQSILGLNLEGISIDASDAIATALCHYYQKGNPLNSGKKYNSWDSFLSDNPDRKLG